MSELRFETNLIVDNVEEATKWLRERSGKKEITIEAVLGRIVLDEEHIFYFDEKLNILSKGETGVHYVWIDTELHEPHGGKELFLSLYHYNGEYMGHYIGSIAFHAKNMANNHPWDSMIIKDNQLLMEQRFTSILSKRREKIIVSNSVLLSVDKILKMEYFSSLNGLAAFIYKVGRRAFTLKRKNKTQYFVINSLENIIVNTGMMDRDNNDIHLLYRWNSLDDSYYATNIIYNKDDYIRFGFTPKQAEQYLQPIDFGDASLNVIGDESIPNNFQQITHFVKEKHNLFPGRVRQLTKSMIVQNIENSLNTGIAIQRHDKNYIKPIYSAKNGTISYLMPMHILNDEGSAPDMVMSFKLNGTKLEMKNLLPYDDKIKDGITALDLYGKVW